MAEPLLSRISALHGPFVNQVALSFTVLVAAASGAFFVNSQPVFGGIFAALAVVVPLLWFVVGYVTLTRTPTLLELVVRHLGPNWHTGTAITHPVPVRDRVNLQLALNALADKGA